MPGFDFDGARRWARFDPRSGLSRRPDDALPFAIDENLAGPALLLDTCVYIDQMQARAPLIVEHLVTTRHVNHSTVTLQELLHTVGVLHPGDPRSAAVIAAIGKQIRAMPDHRVFTPDIETLGRAAILAGMLCRLQGYGRDDRFKALHDATLFLQARKLGMTLLTANVGDFDLLLQLIPTGRVLFYRADDRGPG